MSVLNREHETRYMIQSRRKGCEIWYASSSDFHNLEAAREWFYIFSGNPQNQNYEYRIVKLETHSEVVEPR